MIGMLGVLTLASCMRRSRAIPLSGAEALLLSGAYK